VKETLISGFRFIMALYFAAVDSFFFFSLPILSGRRLDVYHTSTHE